MSLARKLFRGSDARRAAEAYELLGRAGGDVGQVTAMLRPAHATRPERRTAPVANPMRATIGSKGSSRRPPISTGMFDSASNSAAVVSASRDSIRREIVIGYERGGVGGALAPVTVSAEGELGHFGCVGPSGGGKSRWAAALAWEAARCGMRVIVGDPEDNLAELLARGAIAAQRGGHTLQFDELSPLGGAIPPLNALGAAPDEVPDELVVSDVAACIAVEVASCPFGIHQDRLNSKTLLLLRRNRLPLTVGPRVLTDPFLLDAVVRRSGCPDLHSYFTNEFPRLGKQIMAGVVARYELVLNSERTRLALSSRSYMRFSDLLEGRGIAVFRTKLRPGEGAAAAFWNRTAFTGWQRAALERTVDATTRPVLAIFDELPEWTGSSGTAAHELERGLALCRKRKVFIAGLHQSLAQLRQASPALESALKVNATHFVVFRQTAEDARSFTQYLPRIPHGDGVDVSSWLVHLPPRNFLFVDRRSGQPGKFLIAPTFNDPPEPSDEERKALAARSRFGVPLSDLREQADEVERRLAALRADGQAALGATPLPRRGGRRPAAPAPLTLSDDGEVSLG